HDSNLVTSWCTENVRNSAWQSLNEIVVQQIGCLSSKTERGKVWLVLKSNLLPEFRQRLISYESAHVSFGPANRRRAHRILSPIRALILRQGFRLCLCGPEILCLTYIRRFSTIVHSG